MIEIHFVKSGRRPGWRFRMLNDSGETIYNSNGTWDTAEEAKRVASVFDRGCYQGAHKIKVVKSQ